MPANSIHETGVDISGSRPIDQEGELTRSAAVFRLCANSLQVTSLLERRRGVTDAPVVQLAAALALPPLEGTGSKLAIRLCAHSSLATPLQCPSRGGRPGHLFIVQSAVALGHLFIVRGAVGGWPASRLAETFRDDGSGGRWLAARSPRGARENSQSGASLAATVASKSSHTLEIIGESSDWS
jgi:hypothetical protein